MKSQNSYFYEALRLCAERSMERIRKISQENIFELLDLLQDLLDAIEEKFEHPGVEKFEAEEAEIFYAVVKLLIDQLKDEYRDRYKHAISMFSTEMRLFCGSRFNLEICKYPLDEFSIKEPRGWKKCLLQQQEDLMRVHLLAVGLVHGITPSIFYILRGKRSMDYQDLLELFHQAKKGSRDKRVLWDLIKHARKWSYTRKVVQVVFSWLESEIDLFERKDFSSNFAVLRPELEVEMTSILEHYVDKRSCAQKSCTFCLHRSPIWVEKGDFLLRNDIRARLVFAFRYFFYEEFEFVLRQFENHQEQSYKIF